MLFTAESSSPCRKTYVYMEKFFQEHNRPKITMESDWAWSITYIVIWPMYIVLRKKNSKICIRGGGGG